MPHSFECVDKHRNGEFLSCFRCAENELFRLTALGDIDGLSEKIIAKAQKFPEWIPHIPRLGYLVTFTMQETCMNAVEHGILGMDKQEKRRILEEMREGYLPHVERLWHQSGREVRVTTCINPRSIIVGIHDEGDGFDPDINHYSPMNDDDVLELSGRGLLILKSLGLHLLWNKDGNTILCSFRREEIARHDQARKGEGTA